jgi:hypothetical protein
MAIVSCCTAWSWRAEGRERENERASASDRDSEAALRGSSLQRDDTCVDISNTITNRRVKPFLSKGIKNIWDIS